MDHLLAAVDLGSNSFRLSIGRVVEENDARHIFQIDRLKETVRLAAGLNSAKMLSDESIERAINVLERFGDRLRSFHPDRVRAVATNTFRVARNVPDFLPRAEAALGFPIAVIAGREEARLIYAGCVSYSRKFFPDGVIDAYAMKTAELAARREFEVITKPYRKLGWAEAFGSSGTAKALYAILVDGRLSQNGITREGLDRLKQKLIRSGRVVPGDLPGIKVERADVLTGGLAIMTAFFDEFEVDFMQTGDGALRLGVLVDLAGREKASDRRDQSVRAFMKRYNVDVRQAARVKRCALTLFDSLFPDRNPQDEVRHTLSWAADLHEVGMSIAQAGYHKHSSYILHHADMPGFSRVDQAGLALLVLAHNGKLGKAQSLIRNRDQWMAILCLRLAVLLCRRREDVLGVPLTVSVKGSSIVATIDRKWVSNHPLTDFSLLAEETEWNKVGFDFKLIPV